MQTSKWHFELWSRNGVQLADLAGRAKNRRITQSRNQAEEIIWQVGIDDFETYAAASKVDPRTWLVPGQTEVRVRRGGSYLCGGQLVFADTRITTETQDLELRAKGFLDLFKDRFTDELRYFSNTEATTIYATLIQETQAGPNADFGVTIGSLATVGTHDKTFKATNIKEALQRGCELFDFDMEFTHDKVWNTYTSLGSQRPEIVFEYPGSIRTLNAPIDATNIKNRVYVLGSGSGTEGSIRVQVDNAASQVDYLIREARTSFSDVEDTTDLTNHGETELEAWATPFQIPTLEVDGNIEPFVTDYKVGDYVEVRSRQYQLLAGINGMFRIEKRDILIDENDRETIRLYLTI